MSVVQIEVEISRVEREIDECIDRREADELIEERGELEAMLHLAKSPEGAWV